VAYPKAHRADINRDKLWPIVAEYGMRPVTQVAVDDIWSGLRFRPFKPGEPNSQAAAKPDLLKETLRHWLRCPTPPLCPSLLAESGNFPCKYRRRVPQADRPADAARDRSIACPVPKMV
jgi:hypothetical protein